MECKEFPAKQWLQVELNSDKKLKFTVFQGEDLVHAIAILRLTEATSEEEGYTG